MLTETKSIPEALRYGQLNFPAESLLDAIDGIAYLVDREGVILAVSDKLSHAGKPAGGAEAQSGEDVLAEALVVGALDEQVRDAYRRLHDAVCDGRRRHIGFLHRCDSSEVERLAHTSLTPVRSAGRLIAVLYQSQVLRELERPHIALFDHRNYRRNPSPSLARPRVRLCAYCYAVAWPVGASAEDEHWIAPEVYEEIGGPAQVKLRFTVCPSCIETIVEANTRPN